MNKIMNRRIVFEIVLLFFACTSCKNEDLSDKAALAPISPFFIDEYFEATAMEMGEAPPEGDKITWPEDKKGPFPNLVFTGCYLYGRYLNNEETAAMRENVGDTRDTDHRVSTLRPRQASCNHFTKLTITSEAAFNNIPAGEPLDAITKILCATAYPVFKEKHCEEDYMNQKLSGILEGWPKCPLIGVDADYYVPFQPSFFWYEKKVSELQPEDLFLIREFVLIFMDTPEVKNHRMTITLTEENGKKVSVCGNVRFPEGPVD